MANYTGIVLFHSAFTASKSVPDSPPKYSISILFPAGDHEQLRCKADFDAAVLASFPSGIQRNHDVCFSTYQERFEGKDYYKPELASWYVFSCTAQEKDKPPVVDSGHQPIIDPGSELMRPGTVVTVNAGMSGYIKGSGGVGGWLNGIMSSGELGQLGVLDNKPSVESMFGGGAPAAAGAAPVMTAAAAGATYEAMIAVGWTDETLIAQGMMIKPSFV